MTDPPPDAAERPLLLLLNLPGIPPDDGARGVLDAFASAGFQVESASPEPFPERALERATLLAVSAALRGEAEVGPVLADAALRNVPVVWIGPMVDPDEGARIRMLEGRLASAWRAEALGRLVGGVAHDFNNVLSVVTTLTELLIRFGPEDNPDREDLEEIHAAARRGSELTRQLLAFGRADPGEARPLDVNERVLAIRKLLGKLLPEDVELRTELAADLPDVLLDPAEIDQILLELTARARTQLARGGTVRLRTEAVNDGVHVEAVTEPRGEVERSGAGWGERDGDLDEVRLVVQRRGGDLETEASDGAAETIRVRLPSAAPRPDGGPEANGQEMPRGRGHRVLVVEDDGAVRRATCRAVEALGFSPHPVGSLADARRMLGTDAPAPAVVLCDAVLPDGWGTELLESATGDRTEIPFVFVSGHEDHPALADLEGSGTPRLRKPYSGMALARALEAALSGR